MIVVGDPRSQRAAENESAFRAVNERVEQATEGAVGEFVCECVRLDCAQRKRTEQQQAKQRAK